MYIPTQYEIFWLITTTTSNVNEFSILTEEYSH